MSLLVCPQDCSLTELARQQRVHHRDLWLPLRAALPLRASADAKLEVGPCTPLALLDTTTSTLSVDKRAICVKLHVANAMACENTAVVVDPDAAPRGTVAFVRWDRPGMKSVRANTQVLHYILPSTAASAGGARSSRSSYVGNATSSVGGGGAATTSGMKRSRTEDERGVDASTLAEALCGKHHRLSWTQQSSEDMQQRLSRCLQAPHVPPLNPRSLHILQSTLANIQHRSKQPPLHFVLAPEAAALEAGGVTWARTNQRILSRVFRGAASMERSEASKYSDGARQLRFYFIEDVLLHRPRPWAPLKPTGKEERLDAASPTTTKEEVELTLKGPVLADMNHYAERGYRIVFLEHYPVLHHGSKYTVEATLAPVVRLCQECCPDLTVTVVVSAMSIVTAMRRQGMELTFVPPQVGLLRFFVAEQNTSLQPDRHTAAIVGCSERDTPYWNDLHRDFARNAALPYVDVSELP